MRIVFMGTPDFASVILQHLLEHKVDVVGVVTAPDKPLGRGLKVGQSSVKKLSTQHNLPILQPTNLKDETFLSELANLNAELFVVVAFRMLPEVVWKMPPKGTINLHASLLPNYRGAAPIHWAIINGETKTGVTTFFIEQQIDTGNIIEQKAIDIGENETTGELHDRLAQLGAMTTLSTIEQIENGVVKAISQDTLIVEDLRVAPKLFRENCEINFEQNAMQVHNFIRGLSPYPAAWCTIELPNVGKRVMKLYKSELTAKKTNGSKEILTNKNGILFPCNDFYILATEVQGEGKRRMTAKEYLVGNKI